MLESQVKCKLSYMYHFLHVGSQFEEDKLDGGWDTPKVMSPIQYWWKMAVTTADAGPCGSLLVGPADHGGGIILLDLYEDNVTLDISCQDQVLSSFLKVNFNYVGKAEMIA